VRITRPDLPLPHRGLRRRAGRGLLLAALFLSLLFVVRGTSSLLWVRELSRRETLALACFGATGLPLIVAPLPEY
jgi:hypothetical protein